MAEIEKLQCTDSKIEALKKINAIAEAVGNGDLANKDLSNLTAEGEKHFLSKTQITNCITEIPNRIKIEFDTAGKISLLAGSEVFINNGNGFESYVLETDTPFDAGGLWTTDNSRSLIVVYVPDLHTLVANAWDYVTHSTTPPTKFLGTEGTALWEDTSTGQLKITYDTGATWHVCSLPVLNGRAGGTNIGWIGNIDSVFNGFGFFGQKTFTLPNVKKLAPNGRNEDGTLKNIETMTTEVKMYDATGQKSFLVFFAGVQLLPYGVKNYFEQDVRPIFEGQNGAWFDTLRNMFFVTDDYGATWQPRENRVYLGTAYKADASSNFSNLIPKKPLRVVDYGDLKEVISIVETYKNGNSWYRVWSDGWVEQGGQKGANTTTITFLKPFKDYSYYLNILCIRSERTSGGYQWVSGRSPDRAVFLLNEEAGFWYACGYKA